MKPLNTLVSFFASRFVCRPLVGGLLLALALATAPQPSQAGTPPQRPRPATGRRAHLHAKGPLHWLLQAGCTSHHTREHGKRPRFMHRYGTAN